MNYVEFYPGDYLRDTARLSLAEHGAYLLLMADYYANERPLPADLAPLYRVVGAQGAAEQRAVRTVADRYFPIDPDDGLRHNRRVDREIAKAQKRISAARENGARGGRKPKPSGNPMGSPVGYEKETQRDTQWDTQWATQPGEALQTPHATSVPDTSGHTPPSAAGAMLHHDGEGVFEGHAGVPDATPNPVARFAIALASLGFSCTSLNPDLIAYVESGGTVEHLLQCASLPECSGKPANYVIRIARRELSERASPVSGALHGNPGPNGRLTGESLADAAARAISATQSSDHNVVALIPLGGAKHVG